MNQKNRPYALGLRVALLGILLLALPKTYAQSMEGAQVLEVSSSKKSLLLNLGYAEGLRNGDRAKIYLKNLDEGIDYPKFRYVAEGEVINVKNNVSYWFLRKIKNFQSLKKNEMLVLVRQSKDPRRPFVTRRTLRVQGRAEDQDYYQVSEDKGVPEDLVFEEQDFFPSEKLKGTQSLKRQDIEMTRKKTYIDMGEEYDEEFDQIVEGRLVPFDGGDEELIAEIEKKAEDRTFDSTTKTSVGKFNDLKYGLQTLYHSQMRDPGTQTKVTMDSLNARERAAVEDAKRRKVSPSTLARIKREGPRWSQDMTDKQLRAYLVESGIEEEIQRQKRALGEREGHEFTLRYISNLTSNTTAEDPNFQGTDYFLAFSYEWHLYSTSNFFKNFTLEFELERGISHYQIAEGINGRIAEGSLKGYLNWYFMRPPSSLHSYMPYLGVGLKRGNGELESAEFDTVYTVQHTALPSAHFGLKYRFKAGDEKNAALKIGYGVNFQIKYEAMRYNIADVVVDDIEPTFSRNQTRFSVGLNVYF